MDYKRSKIVIRSKNGCFENERVSSCSVVGSLVEASLRLAYRPRVGEMPVPLSLQRPAHFPVVALRDVLPPGYQRAASSIDVKVYPADAELALAVAKDGVSKLQRPPYNLEVNAADHTGSTACRTAHDLVMSTRVGLASSLPAGLYSIEIRCREVIDRKAFPWEDTLTGEAMPLWAAELAAEQSACWSGRILIFAEFPRPCHSGAHSLHASIRQRDATRWNRLWGWAGFTAAMPAQQAPAPKAQAKAVAKAVAKAAAVPAQILQTPQQKWRSLKARLPAVGDWIRLAAFLDELKLPGNQVKRDFLSGPRAWKLGTGRGRKLIVDREWAHKPGRGGGGGPGRGPIHIKAGILEQIFLKYYPQR